MNRGMSRAKTPKEVAAGKKSSKGAAAAVAQIIGIGLVAGAALVIGTDKVMKKLFPGAAEVEKNGQAEKQPEEKEE